MNDHPRSPADAGTPGDAGRPNRPGGSGDLDGPPGPGGSGDRARATRSRRPGQPNAAGWRRLIAAGVAVAVLAVTCAFLWPTLTGGRAVPAASPTAGPATGTTPPGATGPPATDAAALLPAACRGLRPSPGRLPGTAQRLRLCPTGSYAETVYPPLTVLDGPRAEAVLRTLATRPRLTADACTEEYGPDFLLVAETAGAPPVVLRLQLYGCRVVGTGDDLRTDAPAVLAEFLEQVRGQRALGVRPRPAWTPVTLCRGIDATPRSVIPAPIDTLTTVTLCRYAADGRPDSMHPLRAADARTVLADIAARSTDPVRLPCPTPPPGTEPHAWRLALGNPDGDAVLLEPSCAGRFFYATGSDAGERQWVPSPAVAKLLDRITAR